MSGEVVIVIINHKAILSPYETISLRQCIKVLGKYPIWMVVPASLITKSIEHEFPGLNFLRVKDRYLASYRNFNRFKINPFLYQHFSQYRYLLYYELDAFVFEDQLPQWCTMGYDFVGAPWLEKQHSGNVKFISVGNGGLSLRKISSHLKVLRTYKRMYATDFIWKWFTGFNFKGKVYNFFEFIFRLAGLKLNTHWYFNTYDGNEDEFWSHMGSVFPWFRIPAPEQAMQFSFETYPDVLFKLNNQQLPFGCHAWPRDPHFEFWKQYIKETERVE